MVEGYNWVCYLLKVWATKFAQHFRITAHSRVIPDLTIWEEWEALCFLHHHVCISCFCHSFTYEQYQYQFIYILECLHPTQGDRNFIYVKIFFQIATNFFYKLEPINWFRRGSWIHKDEDLLHFIVCCANLWDIFIPTRLGLWNFVG